MTSQKIYATKSVEFLDQRIGTQGFDVDVRYPHFKGTPIEVTRELNRKVKKLVNMNIPAKRSGEGVDCSYSCRFTRESKRLIAHRQ